MTGLVKKRIAVVCFKWKTFYDHFSNLGFVVNYKDSTAENDKAIFYMVSAYLSFICSIEYLDSYIVLKEEITDEQKSETEKIIQMIKIRMGRAKYFVKPKSNGGLK